MAASRARCGTASSVITAKDLVYATQQPCSIPVVFMFRTYGGLHPTWVECPNLRGQESGAAIIVT